MLIDDLKKDELFAHCKSNAACNFYIPEKLQKAKINRNYLLNVCLNIVY
jgi:hypothetical protein